MSTQPQSRRLRARTWIVPLLAAAFCYLLLHVAAARPGPTLLFTALAALMSLAIVLRWPLRGAGLGASSVIARPAPPSFLNIAIRAGFTPEVVLHVAASAAQPSDHQLAQAIVSEAQKRSLPINAVQEFKSHTGYGITGKVDGRIIAVGGYTLMQELGIDVQRAGASNDPVTSDASLVYVSINSYLAGIITLSHAQLGWH